MSGARCLKILNEVLSLNAQEYLSIELRSHFVDSSMKS